MSRVFFDTSALVKNYHAESGTPQVQSLLAIPGGEFFISRLTTVEMLSGFAGKVRTGTLSRSDYATLRKRFLADIRRKTVRPIRVLNSHYQHAGNLIDAYALGRQLRTLDAIQLAVALYFHRVFPLDSFVCADQRLCDAARSEGLTVIQP